MRRTRIHRATHVVAFGLALAAGALTAAPVAAQSEPAPEATTREHAFELGARAGVAWFARSRSIALQHLLKPSLALHGTWPLGERLRLGAAATSILSTNENYRVAGAYALGRYKAYASQSFEWGVSLGVGVGFNAPILHSDLKAEAPVLPYVSAATDASFLLSRGVWLGVELADEELSVVHLGARLAVEL